MYTKKYTFHLSGTHCASCKIVIEDTLSEQDYIRNVRVDLKQETVEVETEGQHPEDLAKTLTSLLQSSGYVVSAERAVKAPEESGVIWKALPIGLGLIALFFLLQKSGILNLGIGGHTTPATSFIIGLVASVSSCLAVVGGLVLSLSATVSKDAVSDVTPMVLFHGGRLISFAVLGGLLGLLGGAIGISFTFTALLGIVASAVMIVLGLNLVGIFEKQVLALPASFFGFFRTVEHKTIAPFLVGVGTFFLPCGFTQAMQVAALSSGSFLGGLLIMSAFALGTLPMLLLLSFGSASFAHSKHAPLFFKSAGVVVIGLGVFALLAGLAGLGIINPLFSI